MSVSKGLMSEFSKELEPGMPKQARAKSGSGGKTVYIEQTTVPNSFNENTSVSGLNPNGEGGALNKLGMELENRGALDIEASGDLSQEYSTIQNKPDRTRFDERVDTDEKDRLRDGKGISDNVKPNMQGAFGAPENKSILRHANKDQGSWFDGLVKEEAGNPFDKATSGDKSNANKDHDGGVVYQKNEIPKDRDNIAQQDLEYKNSDIFGEETNKDELDEHYSKTASPYNGVGPDPYGGGSQLGNQPKQENKQEIEKQFESIQKKSEDRQSRPDDIGRRKNNVPLRDAMGIHLGMLNDALKSTAKHKDSIVYYSNVIDSYFKMGGMIKTDRNKVTAILKQSSYIESTHPNYSTHLDNIANVVNEEIKIAKNVMQYLDSGEVIDLQAIHAHDSFVKEYSLDRKETLKFAIKLAVRYVGNEAIKTSLKLANKFSDHGMTDYADMIDNVIIQESGEIA